MDLQLVTVDNTWDFSVVNGLPITLTGENELTQRALIASFLQKNTIPMLPALGNDWTLYLTGSISLSEIDSQIRATINLLMDRFDYVPYYKVDSATGTVSFSITNVKLAGEA